jgi:hypothetical protein
MGPPTAEQPTVVQPTVMQPTVMQPAAEKVPAAGPPQPPSFWSRKWLGLPVWAWLLIAVLLIGAGIAIAANNASDGESSATPPDTETSIAGETTLATTTTPATTSAATLPATAPATEPTTTAAATTTTAAPTTTTTTPPTTTLPPEPIVFNGTGNDVVDLGAGNTRFILRASHDGQSNFQVELLDQGLQPLDFPFNEIGPVTDATVVMDISSGGQFLQVTADGNWTLQLLDVASVPVVGDSFNGKGKSVVLYDGPAAVFAITHDGESNFQVTLGDTKTGELTDVVVNEIGPYSGRNPISVGPVLIEVAADGNWTFTRG